MIQTSAPRRRRFRWCRAVVIGLLLMACDDGSPGPEPGPEPEPEPEPTRAPQLLETRTLDSTGGQIFRDLYVYVEGAPVGFRRHGPDDLFVGSAGFEFDSEGELLAVEPSRSRMLFFRDDYFYREGQSTGIRRLDAEGLLSAVYDFNYEGDVLSQVVRRDRDSVADADLREQRYSQDGALIGLVRYDVEGRLIAAMDVTTTSDGQPLRIDVSTPSGPSHIVEFEYDPTTLGPPWSPTIIYALTDLEGRDLPLPDPP